MHGKHWLVTWTTYASWLPGDPRGFQTRHSREYVPPPARYAKPGEPVYEAEQYARRHEQSRALAGPAVRLSRSECRIVLESMVARINEIPIQPRVIAVGCWHVHLIAQFGPNWIKPIIKQVKEAGTKSLSRFDADRRLWAGGAHIKSLPDDEALRNAIAYVTKHGLEGAAVYRWPE